MEAIKKEENPHPRGSANPISKVFFFWTRDIFSKGYKKDLEQTDLYTVLKNHKTDSLGDVLEENWKNELVMAKKTKREPNFRNVIIKTFWKKYIFCFIMAIICHVVVRVAQTLLLGKVIKYFNPHSTMDPFEGRIYGGAMIAIIFVRLTFDHHYNHLALGLGMQIRVACISLIYRKLLRLSKTSTDQTATGRVVNLLSNDVCRFDYAVQAIGFLIITPVQAVVVTYFLWTMVGPSSLIGVAWIFLQTMPLQSYLGKVIAKLRKKVAVRTDERMRLMNEIVAGIQVIKMYAWEIPFSKLVEAARRNEIGKVTYSSYLRGFYMSSMVYLERSTLFATLTSCVLLGSDVTPDIVFSMAQFFNNLNQTMAIMYPTAVEYKAESTVSINRLQDLLMEEEAESTPTYLNNILSNAKKETNGQLGSKVNINHDKGVSIVNGFAKWNPMLESDSLTNISFKIPEGKLCAVIGTVGSGKSSLLHAVMHELPLHAGTVTVDGSISYASQEPWLFVGTVRQNILFGQPYQADKYKEVVRVCALQKDFEMFRYGDKTLVGEKGISLSGGQRARINLARAVYRNADVYLLDDPLSAVDAHVGKHLFEQCIKTHLGNKTRILVTHQLQFIKDADIIIILNNGAIENMGTFEEMQNSGLNFAKLLAEKKEDEHEEEQAMEQIPLRRQISDISNPDENEFRRRSQHRASRRSTRRSLRKDGSFRNSFTNEDYTATLRRSIIKRHMRQPSLISANSSTWFGDDMDDVEDEEAIQEMRSKGTISWGTYKSYFCAGGHICFLFMAVFALILAQVSTSAADFWVSFWTTEEGKRYDLKVQQSQKNGTTLVDDTLFNTQTSLIIYGVLIFCCMFITLIRSLMFIKVTMRSSISLHNNMFSCILRGVMRFFDTNPSGRILNRFSKDIGAIDELLPRFMLETIQIFLVLIGLLVNIAIVNPIFIIPMVILGACYYGVTTVYLSTSRNIKRLEGTTRSPVYSHLSDTMTGLTTIRVFGAQDMVKVAFDSRQDEHTAAWSLFVSVSTAFGFWMDILSSLFVAVITLIFFLYGDAIGSKVGLALSQAMIVTGMLQYGLLRGTEVVSQMTSVERVLEYTTIEPEPQLESSPDKKPDPSWPSKGAVTFDNLYLRYAEDQPPVLKNLNFSIQPTHKVGIVGRTGAGKSSLITALFRLANLEGSVIVDDVNTNDLGLHDLRKKISIIPQEPVLFSDSLRHNLDPFDQYPDAELWSALEEVDLKGSVTGLDMQVQEGGSNFSVGQRQLVCLARAILRNNKILVLDEATANVDPETDTFVQDTIRRKFKDCTVLTIAHRLNTIMDSDRVLVMDAGCMMEYDHPHKLLQKTNGYFFKLVQETGPVMSQQLFKIAEAAYKKTLGDEIPLEEFNTS